MNLGRKVTGISGAWGGMPPRRGGGGRLTAGTDGWLETGGDFPLKNKLFFENKRLICIFGIELAIYLM